MHGGQRGMHDGQRGMHTCQFYIAYRACLCYVQDTPTLFLLCVNFFIHYDLACVTWFNYVQVFAGSSLVFFFDDVYIYGDC